MFFIYCDNSENELVCEITYNLEGNYDKLTGAMFISEHENMAGHFEAYGDGKLIYTSPILTTGSLTENIEFGASDTQKLVLKFYGRSGHGLFCMDFATDYCIGNLVAQKNFSDS